MKKKAIEGIPYLGLTQVIPNKAVKYIGVTAERDIAGEPHLFVEVYKNRAEAVTVPVVRIVLTKKDFGTYFPDREEWSGVKLDESSLLWEKSDGQRRNWSDWQKKEERNVLQNPEDLERLKKFYKAPYNVWNGRWWEYICKQQNHITFERWNRAEERKRKRRQDALNDRITHTPELPEKKILKRADLLYFGNQHYLYYKKHGSWAKIACSSCGCVTDGRWKSGISYESQLQRRIEEPEQGKRGTCPLCGAKGLYKCQGKTKEDHIQKTYMFLGQKYREKGVVIRYIEVKKTYKLSEECGQNGTEMTGAAEVLSGVEIARTYFEPGKEPQTDFHKHDPYREKDFWDDCNLGGNYNIRIKDGHVMWETFKALQGTMFQYSALEEYCRQFSKAKPIDYLKSYTETPQLEMLVKLGLTKIVDQLVWGGFGIVNDIDAKRPDEFLGIRKERVKQLIKAKGDTTLLNIMQMEKRIGAAWTDIQISHMAEAGLNHRGELGTMLQYMSIQQILNRISKYAGCEYDTGCRSSTEQLKRTAITYMDYLGMRHTLGYDLTNTVYQQPRSLEDAHAFVIREGDKKQKELRIQEVMTKFPQIHNSYRRLRSRYLYEDDEYLIRPARSAAEIVEEGRTLHHCVGGNGYLGKHNAGESYILMLRAKKDPETPYITVEIEGNRPHILQWYGANDKKPDKEHMQEWLDGYINRLKAGTQELKTAM